LQMLQGKSVDQLGQGGTTYYEWKQDLNCGQGLHHLGYPKLLA